MKIYNVKDKWPQNAATAVTTQLKDPSEKCQK